MRSNEILCKAHLPSFIGFVWLGHVSEQTINTGNAIRQPLDSSSKSSTHLVGIMLDSFLQSYPKAIQSLATTGSEGFWGQD